MVLGVAVWPVVESVWVNGVVVVLCLARDVASVRRDVPQVVVIVPPNV